MLKFYCKLLFVFGLFLNVITVPAVFGIQCYSCDSLVDDGCKDPFNVTLYTPKRCENENFVCVKQEKINREQNRTYLHRGCIQKHYCEILAKASDFCITCTTELCNSSMLMKSSYYFLFVVLLNVIIGNC